MFGYGGGIQGVDWGSAVKELGLAEIGHPVGGEKELVADIFRQVDNTELSCTVIGQFPQNLSQFLPVSLLDAEFAGLLKFIAENHQGDRQVPDFREVILQNSELLLQVAVAGRGRGVPNQADLFGQGLGFADDFGVHREVEVGFSVLFLDEDTLPVPLFGKQKGEALVGQVVFLLGFGKEGFVPFLKAQVGKLVGTEVGGNLLLEDFGPEVKPVDLRLEVKGQGVKKAFARILELLLIGDDDLFVPLCGDRVDACLEDVALGPIRATPGRFLGGRCSRKPADPWPFPPPRPRAACR